MLSLQDILPIFRYSRCTFRPCKAENWPSNVISRSLRKRREIQNQLVAVRAISFAPRGGDGDVVTRRDFFSYISKNKTVNCGSKCDLFEQFCGDPFTLSLTLRKRSHSEQPCVNCFYRRNYSTTTKDNVMRVFDRKTKMVQRNRTAALENYEVFDYIKEEMGYRMFDRICDVKRKFNTAVDLGCGRGHVSKHLFPDMVDNLYMCDHAEKVLEQAAVPSEVTTKKQHVDEEYLPFENDSIDLVFSSLALHWVNDLPGTFKQVHNILKNDGAFIGSMFGGETLFELRVSLQLAELEREGGFAPHISPFTETRDIGDLLNRAGFTLLTIDIDEMVVNYPSIMELMWDLQGMGESNCAWNRKAIVHRDSILAAAAIYKELYGNEDGTVPATFQVLHFIGWKPDPSQKTAAVRGSGQISIKDLGRLDEIMKESKQKDNGNGTPQEK